MASMIFQGGGKNINGCHAGGYRKEIKLRGQKKVEKCPRKLHLGQVRITFFFILHFGGIPGFA